MKTTSYQSVPVIASIIGSKSRKAMYLTHITSLDGSRIYKDKWIPTSWNSKDNNIVNKQTIEWELDSQSLVEFPMNRVSEAMLIDRYTSRNITTIKTRLVNGKINEYIQLTERYIVYIPKWLMANFEEKYTKIIKEETPEIFENDHEYYGVAEETALQSQIQQQFDYINRDTMNFEHIDSLAQWEIDNPEYASYE
jgi:hypothetical protein